MCGDGIPVACRIAWRLTPYSTGLYHSSMTYTLLHLMHPDLIQVPPQFAVAAGVVCALVVLHDRTRHLISPSH